MENDEEVTRSTPVTWAGLTGVVLFLVVWVAGWVLAKGGWATFASVIFFPYSWYLVVEKIMVAMGWA